MNWLSRVRTEPASAPAIPTSLDASWLSQTPITPRAPPPKPKDPNAPDYRYQVNQKLIYERRLPGGSYITAHVQRLQSGFYDSPVIHEDCIDNVRFIAINFVFHPSRSTFRFKSAEINIALHHTGESRRNTLQIVTGLTPRSSSHDHGTQTEAVLQTDLVKNDDCLHDQGGHRPSRPRFLRHAPHLLYGSISPETLNWNFNLAGSLGVSQGPANASLKPSYGVKSSYKVYEMMKIQGSVRTLRSWYGHDYDIEDGELVWTLEENELQKSGLPREFTFVMLLTKGSGGFEESGDVRLEVDVNPKVMGRLGTSYPSLITNLHQYQPFKREILDLDEEVGQVFEPQVKGRGFNFAQIETSFDDFVWLPGNAYSTSEPQYSSIGAQPQNVSQQAQTQPNAQQSPPQTQRPSRRGTRQALPLPSADATLNLRVILESARGTPVPLPMAIANQISDNLPHFNLKVPSHLPRNNSQKPSPTPSIAGSRISTGTTKRTITIGAGAPGPAPAPIIRRSVRKQRSRRELSREFTLSSSPEQETRQPRRQGHGQQEEDPRTSTHDASVDATRDGLLRRTDANDVGATLSRPFSYHQGTHPRTETDYRGNDRNFDLDEDPYHARHPSPTMPNNEPFSLRSSPPTAQEDLSPAPWRQSPEYTTPPAHPPQSHQRSVSSPDSEREDYTNQHEQRPKSKSPFVITNHSASPPAPTSSSPSAPIAIPIPKAQRPMSYPYPLPAPPNGTAIGPAPLKPKLSYTDRPGPAASIIQYDNPPPELTHTPKSTSTHSHTRTHSHAHTNSQASGSGSGFSFPSRSASMRHTSAFLSSGTSPGTGVSAPMSPPRTRKV